MIELEAHNYAMRTKHSLTLKQKKDPSSWEDLVTYWLTIDIHNYSKGNKVLMENNRTKNLIDKKPFYYNDITNYIKNKNQSIPKLKLQTKIIYQKIIEERTERHTIAGEIQWKKQLPNINFEKILKSTYKPLDNHSQKTYITDDYITQQKQTCICTKAQETILKLRLL